MSSILALHENRAATGGAMLNGRRSLEDQGMTSSIPGKIRPGLVRLLASMMACGSTPYRRAICQTHSPGFTMWVVPPAAVVLPAVGAAGWPGLGGVLSTRAGGAGLFRVGGLVRQRAAPRLDGRLLAVRGGGGGALLGRRSGGRAGACR